VSYTTRARRAGEVPGRDYHFISRDRFLGMKAKGDFAEWAKVHDFYYGTLRRPLEQAIRAGRDVILDIDVQGAKQIKRQYSQAVSVFLLPPSWDELERRLASRGTDGREVMRRRLDNARREIRNVMEYDYYIVNDELRAAVNLLEAIVLAERQRSFRVVQWRIGPLRGTSLTTLRR